MSQIKFTKINNLIYTTSYNPLTPDSQSLMYNNQVYKSYARIDLANLETISGYVDNIEIYAKQDTDIANYKLLEKKQLISNNLFITESNLSIIPYGQFNYIYRISNKSGINYNDFIPYWTSSYYITYLHTLNIDRQVFIYISESFSARTYAHGFTDIYYPELGKYIYDKNEYGLLQPASMSLNLYKNVEYKLLFNINGKTVYGIPGTHDNYSLEDMPNYSLSNDAIIQFILSGSAFSFSHNSEKVIAQLQISSSKIDGNIENIHHYHINFENMTSVDYYRNFQNVEYKFTPDTNGNAYLKIKILNGDWNFSNIQIICNNEKGYSPSHTYTYMEMPTEYHNNVYDFKILYYNNNGCRADNASYITNIPFYGRNYLLPVNNHNDLSGIQGGQNSQYYHLTNNEYQGTGTGSFVKQINPIISQSLVISGSLYVSGNISASSQLLTTPPPIQDSTPELKSYYGNGTGNAVLTNPDNWIIITINGVDYKIPLYIS